ncbi:MAG: hydrogenase nickel incorporation protein HypB [Spirochaetales bacterium]|nr:hydrogenase nickel incorporation protein HypB [Spirochaetales bacterium]
MDTIRVMEIKKSVFDDNDQRAAMLRNELQEQGVFLLNLMSSPGSGKTTCLAKTVESLHGSMGIGVMEADIDSDVDARTIGEVGAKVIQLHTGGMCHLDASMTRQGVEGLGTKDLDLIVLENIGNLICPADFDTGASKNAMILSVPEGDDKPLKYPGMFSMADVLIISKMDTLGVFDFDLDAVKERVRALNPNISIFPLSAKTGEGMEAWTQWLQKEVAEWKKGATHA